MDSPRPCNLFFPKAIRFPPHILLVFYTKTKAQGEEKEEWTQEVKDKETKTWRLRPGP